MARGDQLVRQWRIWRLLAASKDCLPAGEIARELGLEAEAARTIRRDLTALRGAGAGIRTQGRGRDVRYGTTDDGPPLRFDADTLLALRLALGLFGPFQGSPLGERLDQLVRDLERRCPERLLQHFRPLADDLFVRPQPGAPRAEGQDAVIAPLRAALKAGRTVHLDYAPLEGPRATREVHPQHLVYGPRGLYLVALDDSRGGAERTFRLARIHGVRVGRPGARRSTADVEARFEGALGVFATGQPERDYVLRLFDRRTAQLLAENPWHTSQRIEPAGEGAWTMTLTLTGSEELFSRVLSLGAAAEVLEPEELRREVAAALRAAAGRYEGDGLTPTTSARRVAGHERIEHAKAKSTRTIR